MTDKEIAIPGGIRPRRVGLSTSKADASRDVWLTAHVDDVVVEVHVAPPGQRPGIGEVPRITFTVGPDGMWKVELARPGQLYGRVVANGRVPVAERATYNHSEGELTSCVCDVGENATFTYCDLDGTNRRPNQGWPKTYKCDHCRRIIHTPTGDVLGVAA